MLYKWWRNWTLGNLARDQHNQTLKGEWPTHPPTNTVWGRPPSRPFLCLWDRCLLMSTSQLDGYLHLSFPHSPDEYCPQQPDSHCTSGSVYMVKKSHPVSTPTSWSVNYGWDRYGNRRNCFINHLLYTLYTLHTLYTLYIIQGLHRWHWESSQIFSGLTGPTRFPGWGGFTE